MRSDAQTQDNPVGERPDLESPHIRGLVARVRTGDREAAVEFARIYAPVIRQRLRRKLTPGFRRLMDSSDLVSTLQRRLDFIVREGRVRAESGPQLFKLMVEIASRTVSDRYRLLDRIERLEGAEATRLRGNDPSPNADPDALDAALERAFDAVGSERDREILALWLQGLEHTQIAKAVGSNANAVRQRWHHIRRRLKDTLDLEGNAGDVQRPDPN